LIFRRSFLTPGRILLGVSLLLAAASAEAKTHRVSIGGMKFVPDTLVIEKGDQVVWTNSDIVPHTATAQAFDSGSIAVSKTFRFKFKREGSFPYKCLFHPSMTGTITVK
jgi:plastocyanin